MPQIEDMSWTSARPAQNFFCARLDFFPISEQHHRVQIPLDTHTASEVAPTVIKWNTPVETNNFSSRFPHGWQQSRAIRTEIYDGRSSLPETSYEFFCTRQDVPPI